MYEFMEVDRISNGIDEKVIGARRDDKDVRSNREVRNEEIPKNKLINENTANQNNSKNATTTTTPPTTTPNKVMADDSMIFYIMSWLSNTVMLMLFSTGAYTIQFTFPELNFT